MILASRASAISLNEAAQAPNSSFDSTGSRVSRSPSASEWAATLALATGRSMRRASNAPDERSEEHDSAQDVEEDVAQLAQLVPEPLLGEEVVEHGVCELGTRPPTTRYGVPLIRSRS